LSRDGTGPLPDHRAVTLLVRANFASAAVTVATITVQVTAPDMTTPLLFNIPIVNGVATGTVTISAGANRTITMRAFDTGGVQTHEGSITVNIQQGANPPIAIVLTPLAGSVPITVTLGTVTVTISPAADTLTVGDTTTLTARVALSDGTPVTGLVSWATFGPGVATVVSTGDNTGRVTAIGSGPTSIVAVFAATAGSAPVVVSATPSFKLVASGLTAPLYVTAPANDTGRIFLVEQPGLIHLIEHGVMLATPFLDIQSLVNYSSERGLLSMAFHPNYAQNGYFFVYYGDVVGTIHVVRYTVSASNANAADPASAYAILTLSHPANAFHYGGLVMFGPDGYLYIGTGDGGTVRDTAGNAQDSTKLLGKILRIDVNNGTPYAIPPTNPFVGRPPAAPEVWAYGLRNPWRFSFHALAHDLYIADVGQDGMEEVDVQPAASSGGQNYGWNIMEGTLCFKPPSGCNQTGLTLPTYTYPHGVNDANGCSIIGGYVYRGTRLPALIGRYMFADLCGGWVKSFRYRNGTATDTVNYTPQLGILACPAPFAPFTITSFGEDARGELYITTQCGNVYRIAPK
jgi:glucose/arabinose dehydrogenase